MQDQPQANTAGNDWQSVIKTFGPMAAVAAGIIMARGAKAKEMGDILRKLAPQHFSQANKSPFPHMLDTAPSVAGPTYSVSGRPSAIQDLLSKVSGMPETGPMFEQAGKFLGREPRHMGILNVPEEFLSNPSSAVHEFGHLAGFERARERFPRGNPLDVGNLGMTHLDILGDPKTQASIKGGMTDPRLRSYLEGRLATGLRHNQPEHLALGEYLTELWAKRIMGKAGAPWKSVTETPEWNYSAQAVDRNKSYANRISDAVGRTGALPEPYRGSQQSALARLLQELQATEAAGARTLSGARGPASPAKPSP